MRLKLLFILALVETAESLCQNVWKYPQNCSGNCTYQLVWRFKPQDDSIEFIVSSKHTQRWTGVGFAPDRNLTNSDAIFAWIEENTRYVMMDAFLPTYTNPISDKLQSISNISATVSNGLISFRFTRKRNTGDSQEDLIFGDDKCPYLIYPVEGGTVDIKNRVVITSEFAPKISETPVCIRVCGYKPQQQQVSPEVRQITPTAPQNLPAQQNSSALQSSAPVAPTLQPIVPKLQPVALPTTTTTSTSTTTTARPTTTTTTTTTRAPTLAPTTSTTSTTTTTTTTRAPTTTAKTASTSALPSAPTTEAAPTNQEVQWCIGRWSHPPNCRFQAAETLAYLKQPIDSSINIKPLPLEMSDCTYFAQWQYLEASDSVEFIIQTKTRSKWTGIGFSNSTKMPNSDAIIGLIEESSGRHFIMDTWLKDHVMPEIDQHQNTESTWGKRENGTTTVRFRRKRITGDQYDFQFTDESCAYFFFPTQGGSFNAISKRMHKHESVPSVSKQRICIKSCNKLDSPPVQPVNKQLEAPTSQPAESSQEPSSTSSFSSSQTPPITSPPDNNIIDLAPSNDLGADIDSSPSASSGSAQQNNGSSNHKSNDANPFSRLAFLTEPSLRWLAGIGCVATLLAMIVFQACFTVYKNKQAYKHNLYRQSALKQNAFIANGSTSIEGHQSQHLNSYTHPQSSLQPQPYPSVRPDMAMTGGHEESSVLDELEEDEDEELEEAEKSENSDEDDDLDYEGYFYHNQHLQQPPHNHRYPNQQIEHASYHNSTNPCRRHHQHLHHQHQHQQHQHHHHHHAQRQSSPHQKHPNNHQRHLHDYHRNPYYVQQQQQQQQPLRAHQPSRPDSYFLPSQRRY